MPIYKLNGDTYDIPDDVVADFEKDNPSATITYHADGDEYEIPVSERDGFLQEFPDATTEIQTAGPGSTKQPMEDALRQQQAAAPAPTPEPATAPASAPTKEKKTGGYKPTAQEMAGFQSTINNAGFAAATAAPSFEKKAANLQKRQGIKTPKQVKVGETGNLVEGEQRLNPETGQLEQSYITSQGNEYGSKAQAENEQRQIDDYDRRMRYATGQGIDDLSEKYVNPLVDKAMKDADERWFASMKESSSVPMGEGMEMFALRRANEAVDPEKILQGLQKSLEESYKNPEMQKEIDRLANSIGVSREEYLQQILAPSLAQRLENSFAQSQIAQNMPKSTTEYILRGIGDSIGGMLMGAATETKGQRFYRNQADAMTESGDNPYYTPGTGAKLTKMGISFAADAPFFGVYGRVSGQVAKNIAERQIQKLVAQGLSQSAARSVVGTALENSVGARMKNYLMQHIVSSSLTLGAYNATSESARQIRDKEGLDLGKIAGSTAEGMLTGAAFGGVGGFSQALSQPLSGFAKLGAKAAGFGTEAGTLYGTEELAKLAHGEEAFSNPFTEGYVEAIEKLGVMKLSGGHLLGSAANKITRAREVGAGQAAQETLAQMMGQNRTGVKFTEDEQNYVRNTQKGQSLIDALSQMHPGKAVSEVNGKKKLTKEGEALRVQLAQNYEDFMNNKDIPASVKQKTAAVLGGVYRPGLETGADIIQNEDGSVLVKTRDKDGNCIQDLKFDNLADAEQWRADHQSQCRRNDAVNMWNGATDAERQDIVNTIKDNVSGKAVLDEMKSQAAGMKQKRLIRQLEKINETAGQYEGREMTDEEARNFIQTVIRDGDEAVFDEMYQLIHEKAHPADVPDTKRNYWEGQQLSPMDRHFAQVDAQVAEERLMLQGEDFAREVMNDSQYPDEKIAELADRLSRGGITTEQFNAAVDYYNKMSKVEGMFDEAIKSVDNQVEAANANVRRNTHSDSGSLIDATYAKMPERQFYVTAGHFEVGPDGRLRPTDNSGMVILRDKQTGDIEVVNPEEVMVSHIDDPNRVIAENESMEGLRGQLMREADDSVELHPDTPAEPAEDGEVFTGADGKQYMTLRMQDEAGNTQWAKIAIDEAGNPVGEPMPFDMAEYRKAKSDEIDRAERPQEETVLPEDNQVTTEPQPLEEPAAETVVEAPKPETKAAGGEAGVVEGTGVNEPSAEVSSKIPVDEKGRKLYEQATPEDTLADLTAEHGEEKAQRMISQMAENVGKKLEDLKKKDISGMTDMNDIDAHEREVDALQQKYDYWNGLNNELKTRQVKKAKEYNQKLIDAKDLNELEAAYKEAIKAGVPKESLSEVYEAKKSWENLVNPKEIRNFATDPESQTKWVDEHFDEIVDLYSKSHGNKLDPDEVRRAFTSIGYTGKNVDEFRSNEVRLVRAIYEKKLKDAVESGNTSVTLLTGAGGAGKSTATNQIDLSDRGVVYDSALNSFMSLERAILTAKKAGMTDIQVIAVYNDAQQSFSNTLKRGLETERFLPIGYFTKAFLNNQGKIAQLKEAYPYVDIVCFDNSGNKSAERPNGGRVSVEEAEKWDYTVDEDKFKQLIKLIEDGINEGRFREDQLASIGRGLRDASRLVGEISQATEERIRQLVGRIPGEDVADLRPGNAEQQSGSGRGSLVPPTDGEVQGSSNQRGNEEEPARPGSDDDGPEPPAAGGAAGGLQPGRDGTVTSGTGTSSTGGTGVVPAAGSPSGASETRPGGGSGSSGNNAGGTGKLNQGAGSGQSPVNPKQIKKAQKLVEDNFNRTFNYTNSQGNRFVVTVKNIDHNGNVVLVTQTFDPQGRPVNEAHEERHPFQRVAEMIDKKIWKKELDVDETLRQKYKFDKFKVGDIPVIDVLTDSEKRQILDAFERGNTDEVGYLTGEFRNNHKEDIILRGREIRNEKVEKVMSSSGGRGERLRKVRNLYDRMGDADSYLEDGAMQPTTLEEYVADLLGEVPKPGSGSIAYTSYGEGENRVIGLQDETGFGSRGFGGDTKGFNPWLAPKGQGISLKQFAEKIHSQLPEAIQEQFTDQDVRNAIHSILTGAEKPSDISNYILNNRVRQAEAEARNEEERWMEEPNYQKMVDDNSFGSRLQRGKESVNTEPTEGQKEAGNYKKGHVSFGGYDFTIENPQGSMRRGKDKTGREWEQKMNNTYGYILGKFGKDGDHLDMFINDAQDLDNWNGNVYVVDQVDPKTGKWDEHKILYGFDSLKEAKQAYLSNYEEGWQGLGKITGISKEGFDEWLDSSKRKMKEFADHSVTKKHMVERETTNFDTALKQLSTRGVSINDPDLMREYGLKDLTLSKFGDHVTLNKIVVENQGQGNGTRFMEDLASLADQNGWTLALTPSGGFGAKSIKRLKDFYKRFGFVDNKGRNPDFQTRESMIRRPKEYEETNTPERQEQTLRDAVVEHLRSKGIEVSTDWKLGQKILDDYNSRFSVGEDTDSYEVKPQKVTDQQTLDELNNGKTVKRYRAMQLIDGKLYPPMSAKVDGEMRQPTEIGVWEQAEERPDLIKNGKFTLNKGQKGQGNVPAAYNPYFHTSTSGLNDQFTSAYKRPELVVVEVEIPESELTSGYKAEGAKDAVGNVDWHSGVVNGQLPADRQRQVTLSRYSKVNRVVPDSEVADMIAKQLEGTNVEVPYNVVTPQLRKALEECGVKISDKPAGSVTEDINGNPVEKGAKMFKTKDGHAYGYTKDGKIYVDPRIATTETPIHEYGHLWCEMKRETAPEEWNQFKQVMLGDKLVQPIIDKVKSEYPELNKEGREDDFVEEIITQFSGKRGNERLQEIANEIAQEKGGIFGKAEAVAAMQRLKSILNRFWEGVAKMMGWKYTNANQIADRIMADMLNGVNPRERMKQASDAIRGQQERQTLMGVHNLSEEKLRKVLKQGGLANPSLAVIDTDQHMHSDYGEISLIPKASMIDARTGRNAGTFTADAWTPSYPKVEKRMSDKGQSRFWKDLRDLNKEAGEMSNKMRMAFDTWLEHETGEERLAFWYLKDKGLNPETVLFKTPYSKEMSDRLDDLTDNGNKDIRSLSDEEIKEVADMYHAYKESIGEPVNPAEDRIKKLEERIDPAKESPFTMIQKQRVEDLKKYGETVNVLSSFVDRVRRLAYEDGRVDTESTIENAAKMLYSQNLHDDFKKWLDQKSEDYGIDEWLYNGTDNQGRQKWVRNTLENASRLMRKEGLNGAVGWSNLGSWIATVAKKEKTLEGIRRNKKNLNTTEKEHDAWKENWGNRLYPIVERLGNGDPFNGDNIMKDILEHDDYAGYYKREYGKELTKQEKETIDEFIKEVRTNFPTGYFETKFERPVMLNEFEIAVVPESTSPDIVKALKDAGLDVRTYDTSDYDTKEEKRRQAAMDAVKDRDDIRFQLVGKKGAAEADKAEGDTRRMENLKLAEEAEKQGMDAHAIKFATGWEKGKDGQWRYETTDPKVDVIDAAAKASRMQQEKMRELNHKASDLQDKYYRLTSQIPDRLDKRYTEEQKAKYRKMRKQANQIWKEYREASDKASDYRENTRRNIETKLVDVIGEDNELFKYYPELKDMPVIFSENMQPGVAGSLGEEGIKLNTNEMNRFATRALDNENIYGTLLHEIQHAVQFIEGFAPGGNLYTSTTEEGLAAIIAKKQDRRNYLKERIDADRKILNEPNLKEWAELEGKSEEDFKNDLLARLEEMEDEYINLRLQIEQLRQTKSPARTDAIDLYRRIAGEVEARNATSRMNMTDEERMTSIAEETEDVPRDQQVVITDDGGDKSSLSQENENNSLKFQKADGDIHSDNFKNFFGDWEKDPEKASKVIDGDGKPLIVYRGGTDWDEHTIENASSEAMYGKAFYATPSLGGAEEYAIERTGDKKNIHPVYIDVRHPFVDGYVDGFNHPDPASDDDVKVLIDALSEKGLKNGREWWFKYKNGRINGSILGHLAGADYEGVERPAFSWWHAADIVQETLKELGYDGVIGMYTGEVFRMPQVAAFDMKQVRRAENNIRFQVAGNPEPEMTPEERQYWNKWDAAMKKWKERNAIPEGETQAPEKPRYQQGESALDYAQKLVQWNRQKALWNTAPKLEDYRQVRDIKDNVEAAREVEKRYPDSPSAKMRRVAAELQQIRSAMSRQKAYDKSTVKAVTDFAQEFMKMGFGDNLSRGEMERMLSSVKNATGAKDIKKEVDNIMNILIDNHLRNLDQQVQKLSSTKELSKTAQGVEKQGRLELKGQRMIQAFRDAREKRMTVEQIRERMATVAERMNRNDEEAPMWEQEYEGLSIALQYAENIEGSRSEWADLDREYKDAVKEYKTSGRSYKAQQELLEALDQAMQENKIDRIGLFGDIIGRLQGNISESMEGAKAFVEREKQRQKRIWDMANFDLAGKDMGAMREKSKGKPANFFLQPLGTFEQMLKQFGSRNANGEGYLYDYFMRNWMDATDKAYVNEQKAKTELDTKAREVFGDKVKRWSDLYDLERKLPMMEVEVFDGEEPKTFKLTQGNLLYIYMADKMTDGRMKLRKMGIDEDKVEAIKEFMDPRLVELGDWLQNEYLPGKRTEYNKVHERMFGAPMAAIDNYFPLKVLGDARYQEQDVNVPDSETLPSTITGNIIKRRKNALPLDILHTDALSLAIEHVEDMERWAAQAEWNKDINTLLSYTTFRNKVKNMDTVYGSGDALWNAFKDAAKMAAGTYDPSAKSGHIDKAISNIAKGVTAAKINFRVYTAFKQLLSAPAFLHDVNLADFVHDAINPYGSWKWAMENMPVFKKRWKSRQVGDTRLMDDPTDWKYWKNNIVQTATRLGMSPNALVDGVTCAVGARSIYKSRYKKYKDIGASNEVAHKRALQDAEIGYNLTQQSSEGAFVSAIQKDRTVAANMLSVFRNSSMAYTRQWYDAARNLRKRTQKGYKEDSIKFMTRQMQEQFGLEEDQAKRAAELEYAREGRRDVARLLNMMFGVTIAWNLGVSLPYLLIGDDDHTKKEMLTDAMLKGLMAGPTEGFAAGNLYSDFIGRTLASEETRNTFKEGGIGAALDAALKQGADYEINPLPLMADIQSMIKKMGYDKYAAAQDVFNIAMQSAVGVNPQTFTDMWNAAMDYGAPGWDGRSYYPDDENLTRPKELALFMMRLINAPTSSWRNKYIDELGMNAEDAKKLPYHEMARRYAHYKHWKDAPVMGWLRGDEARNEKIDKMQGQFDKAVEERMNRLSNKELADNLARSIDPEEKRKYAKIAAKRLGVDPGPDSQKPDTKDWYQEYYQQRMTIEDINEDELLIAKKKDLRDDKAKKEINKRLDWIRDGKYNSETGRKGKHKNPEDDPELLEPGKRQLSSIEETVGDDKRNEAIMRNIRKWRREALEIAIKAESGR